jgi:hypothetical protein
VVATPSAIAPKIHSGKGSAIEGIPKKTSDMGTPQLEIAKIARKPTIAISRTKRRRDMRGTHAKIA